MAKKKTLADIIQEMNSIKAELGAGLVDRLLPMVGAEMTVSRVVKLVEIGLGVEKKLGIKDMETFNRFLMKASASMTKKQDDRHDAAPPADSPNN